PSTWLWEPALAADRLPDPCECEPALFVANEPAPWLWDGRFATARVAVAEPSLFPTPAPSAAPIGSRPRKSGRLNVVDPLPAPNLVPITSNSRAYCVLDTARPSQSSQPAGAASPA